MRVTVKVSELRKKIEELETEEIEYVDITFLDEDEFEGHKIPKSLHFEGYDGYGGGIDFDTVDDVKISSCYKSEREFDEQNKDKELLN